MIEGYYINCDDALCEDHFDPDSWDGFEEWEEPLTITIFEEADTPTHCVECGVLIRHNLTEDGYDYVHEAINDCLRAGKLNPVTFQWADYYGNDDMFEADFEAFFKLPLDTAWLREDLIHYLDHVPDEAITIPA